MSKSFNKGNNCRKRQNYKMNNFDLMKAEHLRKDLNMALEIENKMKILKDYYLWIAKQEYDANYIVSLLEYEKFLKDK